MRRHLSRLNDEHRMRLSSEQIAEFEGLGNEEGIARMQAVAGVAVARECAEP